MRNLQIGAATSVGLVRKHNEDAYWYSDCVFVVCDGMGGHQGGEVASALAIEVIKDYQFSGEPLEDIAQAIMLAHERVIAEARKLGLTGMGTTVTMALIKESKLAQNYDLHIGHVGDSRAYLLREEVLTQITNDHSVVAELLRNGSLTQHEAITHPHRNIVTQALGIEKIEVETKSFSTRPGDKILLCSDGLTDVVNDGLIHKVLSENQPEQAATELVNLANQKGGPDNITALVILVP